MSLPKSFYKKPTLELAKSLLGKKLVTNISGKRTSGMIVEVEAYHGHVDEAAHSYRGMTKRNAIMFGEAGFCYVYFIYGMHYCVNVVSEPTKIGAAILIRALEPLDGIEIMERRRGIRNKSNLTNGPAKLCEALKIDKKMLGENFRDSKIISIEPYKNYSKDEIGTSARIGISKSKELEWRFYVKDNPFVSY